MCNKYSKNIQKVNKNNFKALLKNSEKDIHKWKGKNACLCIERSCILKRAILLPTN